MSEYDESDDIADLLRSSLREQANATQQTPPSENPEAPEDSEAHDDEGHGSISAMNSSLSRRNNSPTNNEQHCSMLPFRRRHEPHSRRKLQHGSTQTSGKTAIGVLQHRDG